jgi:hypothetical protein
LGTGRRLFGDTGSDPCSFQLTSSTTTGTGVFIGTYRSAGS